MVILWFIGATNLLLSPRPSKWGPNDSAQIPYTSCTLNSLTGACIGHYTGGIIGLITEDARSLDYRSYNIGYFE